jgi:hypothetical protein
MNSGIQYAHYSTKISTVGDPELQLSEKFRMSSSYGMSDLHDVYSPIIML